MDRNVQHGEYAFFLIAVIRAVPHNVHHTGCDILPRSIKSSQIRNELARLDNEQTDFYRNNDRAKHTRTEKGSITRYIQPQYRESILSDRDVGTPCGKPAVFCEHAVIIT